MYHHRKTVKSTYCCEIEKQDSLAPCSTQLNMKFQLLIKTKMPNNNSLFCFQTLFVAFSMLINVKMPTIVGILTLMRMISFMLSLVEHEKSIPLVEPCRAKARISHNQQMKVLTQVVIESEA